ncbi:reactive intermediate/imine deaminase [Azospirillum lipoferum]|uniref:RidA family protein n=1 Tax=Azospirillum lipoferum TaxID=193 RepID=A0A5A9GP16_AZOLI|nr:MULTISPECIES: RidA family protein [Azospirillum]KAA0596147.1 RidA family protein [Azospirillum lipoferum]MCP1611097.1 reactive intermediate/imine deaminase [Azospirillum lipoferum]MDW5533778.1 RidA family protein [Azospirillum sp. NL1]
MTDSKAQGLDVAPISTDGVAPAGGHYSQGVRHGDLIYVSGQLPIAPDGTHHAAADFDRQARLAIRNMIAVVEAAGGTTATLLKVTVYLVGIANWPRFNAIYAEMLGDARPARSVVPVPELHYGYLVEIDAVAVSSGTSPPSAGSSV